MDYNEETRYKITQNARQIMSDMLKEGMDEFIEGFKLGANTDSIYFEAHKQENNIEDTTYEVVEDKQLPEGQPDSSS